MCLNCPVDSAYSDRAFGNVIDRESEFAAGLEDAERLANGSIRAISQMYQVPSMISARKLPVLLKKEIICDSAT